MKVPSQHLSQMHRKNDFSKLIETFGIAVFVIVIAYYVTTGHKQPAAPQQSSIITVKVVPDDSPAPPAGLDSFYKDKRSRMPVAGP